MIVHIVTIPILHTAFLQTTKLTSKHRALSEDFHVTDLHKTNDDNECVLCEEFSNKAG